MPGKQGGLASGLLGLWVFLALTIPLAFFFGGEVFPTYQCHGQTCSFNRRAGAVASLVLLAFTLLLVFVLPPAAARFQRDPGRRSDHPPIIRQRIREAPPPGSAPGGGARFLGYILLMTVGASVWFFVGAAHFDASFCSARDFEGECDVAVGEGFVWSACWIAFVLALMVSIELQLGVNRYLRRSP